MRRAVLWACALAVPLALVPGLPARGASQTVDATFNNLFSPRVTAVRPGETVTFVNRGGIHDVDWEDPHPTQPPRAGEGWTVQRSFTRVGAYRYYCSLHGSRGGIGQAGVVYVTASGAVPPPGLISASAVGSASAMTLRIEATERGVLQGRVLRGAAAFGVFSRTALGGRSTLRVSSTSAGRLRPGRYRVILRLLAGARRSAPRTLAVTVR